MVINSFFHVLENITAYSVNFLVKTLDYDTTTLYLVPGTFSYKICDCDASSQIPDYDNISFEFNWLDSIEYIPNYGTILDASNIPKGAVIKFKNVPFIILNISDF